MTASLACGGETPAAVRGGAGAGRRPPPARAGGRGGMGRAGRAAAAAGLRPKRFTLRGLWGYAKMVKW